MGSDSVEPFLEFNKKHTILLALTSNVGAFDFQTNDNANTTLFESVLQASKTWKNSKQLMYVVGATKAAYFKKIRDIVPNSFLLVPGIGAQGGSLEEVCKYGLNDEVGLLVNSSRGIIYASNDRDFAAQAANKAKAMQQRMQEILSYN
jgi:orotidine-5'-phosphate decarboxylase